MMEKPLHTLGLMETCEGLRDGRFTAEAYTRALLARIAARDEAIQAARRPGRRRRQTP
jgi:Asp-tRNA(Asn)/Glu-tRNA(Gln) amidotransferase A subunit family amidase